MRSMLDGVRVIDFTGNIAGPATTTFLADMGAEVIKVEKPGLGDDARLFPPYVNGFSAPFIVMNRAKKGVVIDMKKPEGVAVFKELVAVSDVLVENFKPGVMERLGLDYETLKKVNPKLVMLSLSGYGQYGPLSKRPAYDSIIQACSGIMDVTGFPDGPPTKAGPIIIDLATAMQAAFAVCAALFARERTGEGEYLDVSMYDTAVNLLAGVWTDYTVTGNIPGRTGNRYPYVSPFDTFHARDGYFMICSAGDATYHRLCDAMERPDLKTDPRFVNLFVRNDNEPELRAIIQEWVESRTTEELMEITTKHDVPASPIRNVKEVVEHPHTIERGLPVEVEQPGRGKVVIYGPPTKAKNSEVKARGAAPEHGQHTEWMLTELLKKTSNEIEALKESGVVK
ncbi:MAG: CoA transferase [Spirochaetes bacterium]|nr:CoA transferase [Spirochaetota bacterium]